MPCSTPYVLTLGIGELIPCDIDYLLLARRELIRSAASWCPLNLKFPGDCFSFSSSPNNMGGSSLTENCIVEKSSSVHLSAELNCGISLEVKGLFSQRCDPFSFFGRLIGCRNAIPLETASCWGLVHCSCAIIQYQEQAENKGTGFRQCYSVRAINQCCKLCSVEAPEVFHTEICSDWERHHLVTTFGCRALWQQDTMHRSFMGLILGIGA